jgi:hypothetical protein
LNCAIRTSSLTTEYFSTGLGKPGKKGIRIIDKNGTKADSGKGEAQVNGNDILK